MTVPASVLHKNLLFGREPIKFVKRLVHGAFVGLNSGDLCGQCRNTLEELCGGRCIRRCRRAPQSAANRAASRGGPLRKSHCQYAAVKMPASSSR